ncbi:kinase-like domain-containing protein [Tanacetum coccineum]
MNSPQAMICLSASSRISFLFYGLSIICLTFATVSTSYGGNETDYLARFGISCGKRHKRVTALRLDSQGLEGSLSPHVRNLSFLRQLDLYDLWLAQNKLDGSVFKEMSLLSKLDTLVIEDNKFNRWNPTFLGEYHINGNVLCCREPVGWEHSRYLGSLEKLDGILLCLPSEFQLPNLELLQLRDNELTRVLPPSISNCSKLGFLDMT